MAPHRGHPPGPLRPPPVTVANPNKARGTAWETAVVRYLQEHGSPAARRNAQHGAKDIGDIGGVPGFALEAKDDASHDFSGWLRQAIREAENAGEPYAAVIAKRRRHPVEGAYVLMDLETFARLAARLATAERDADDAATWSIADAFPDPPDDEGRRWVYVDDVEAVILRGLDS